MKISGVDPETGSEFEAEADSVTPEFVRSMSENNLSDVKIKKLIDDLSCSADTKVFLYSFSKATIKVGEYVVKIGRKILDFICSMYQEYPSATFGMIFGAIAGFLIASIPIIGVVLGPIFTPIAIALGLIGGLREDLKDKALVRKVAEINASFSPLAE